MVFARGSAPVGARVPIRIDEASEYDLFGTLLSHP
jgi:hypothetical protein